MKLSRISVIINTAFERRTMKGLVLDTETNEIRKVEAEELHDYYKAMHCDCIDVVHTRLLGQHIAIVCDDEALCKDKVPIHSVTLPRGRHIFNSVIFTLIEPGSDDFSDLSKDLEDAILQRVIHDEFGHVIVVL